MALNKRDYLRPPGPTPAKDGHDVRNKRYGRGRAGFRMIELGSCFIAVDTVRKRRNNGGKCRSTDEEIEGRTESANAEPLAVRRSCSTALSGVICRRSLHCRVSMLGLVGSKILSISESVPRGFNPLRKTIAANQPLFEAQTCPYMSALSLKASKVEAPDTDTPHHHVYLRYWTRTHQRQRWRAVLY